MKSFYIDGEFYDITLDEYYEMQEMQFAAEFNISSQKAKEIIRALDLRDELTDRYDEEIGDCLVREAREYYKEKGYAAIRY